MLYYMEHISRVSDWFVALASQFKVGRESVVLFTASLVCPGVAVNRMSFPIDRRMLERIIGIRTCLSSIGRAPL